MRSAGHTALRAGRYDRAMKYEDQGMYGVGLLSVCLVLLVFVSVLLYLIRGPERADPLTPANNSNSSANDNPFLDMGTGKGTGKHG